MATNMFFLEEHIFFVTLEEFNEFASFQPTKNQGFDPL
jgi:hypothetical protein